MKICRLPLLMFAVISLLAGLALKADYKSNFESLNTRECPSWWKEAKFGIFIHWGVYSVPAFAPTGEKSVYDCYAEHYWRFLKEGRPAFVAHHQKNYPGMSYMDFAPAFTAKNWDPAKWADLFKRAGARYVVLTSKHHEGFALWPSAYSPYWNASVLGPRRDICGELTDAVKGAGLKMGFYYSLLEWNHPLYRPETIDQYVAQVNLPQIKELVTRYKPDIFWPDGEWDYSKETLRSAEILSWLYNESPVKDTVVTNDRWGKGFRGRCGDHYTTEYDEDGKSRGKQFAHPWEECRGLGRSFGYNRMEGPENYLSNEGVVEVLAEKISRGGNLLLNVGPTADGRIPAILQERLLALGAWLEINGEAVYGSRAWERRPADMRKSRVYFTRKGNAVYAIVFDPKRVIAVKGIVPRSVSALGSSEPVQVESTDEGLLIHPVPSPSSLAIVYRLAL